MLCWLRFTVLVYISCFPWNNVSGCNNTAPCKFKGGELLEHLDQLSVNSTHPGNINVSLIEIKLEWFTTNRRVFNGKLAAPTIRFTETDGLHIRLTNNLPGNPVSPTNYSINRVMLDISGLRLHPDTFERDSLQDLINPGESTSISRNIFNRNSGTYLYGTYTNGSSHFMISSGLCGMAVVEDSSSNIHEILFNISCPDHCGDEIQLLFGSTMQYSQSGGDFGSLQSTVGDEDNRNLEILTGTNQTLEDWLRDDNNGVNYVTVNGQIQPTLTLQTGQMKRFRLASCCATQALNLTFDRSHCDVREVASDGSYHSNPREPATLLLPGSTFDWIVVCNTPGTFQVGKLLFT
ncbi:uncharacterized protein LOC144742515 [Ciona intestinalis]